MASVPQALARLDTVTELLTRTRCPLNVFLPLGEAAELLAAVRDTAAVVYLPVPAKHAGRWPDPAEYNNGHDPHITVMFVLPAEKVTAAEESTILNVVRYGCRRVKPFKVRLDVGRGLQDFGDGPDGKKALWFPVLSEPKGELDRLHRILRMAFQSDGTIEPESHKSFVGHCTWAYVPNDIKEEERARWVTSATSALSDIAPWVVDRVMVSLPHRGNLPIMLNPSATGQL